MKLTETERTTLTAVFVGTHKAVMADLGALHAGTALAVLNRFCSEVRKYDPRLADRFDTSLAVGGNHAPGLRMERGGA